MFHAGEIRTLELIIYAFIISNGEEIVLKSEQIRGWQVLERIAVDHNGSVRMSIWDIEGILRICNQTKTIAPFFH